MVKIVTQCACLCPVFKIWMNLPGWIVQAIVRPQSTALHWACLLQHVLSGINDWVCEPIIGLRRISLSEAEFLKLQLWNLHLDIRLLTLVFLDANVVVFVEISGLFPLLPRFFASVFHPFASFAWSPSPQLSQHWISLLQHAFDCSKAFASCEHFPHFFWHLLP